MRSSGAIAVLALAGATVVLGACAASGPPPDPTEEEILAIRLEEQLWSWTMMFPDEDPPQVEPIRSVSFEEWGAVITDCLDAAEIPTFERTGNTWTFDDGSRDAMEAFQRASWICDQQYPGPVNPTFYLSDAQLQWWHGFVRDRYVPCIARHGYRPIGLPTTLITEFQGPMNYPDWLPHSDALSPRPSSVQLAELDEACPLPEYILPWTGREYVVDG